MCFFELGDCDWYFFDSLRHQEENVEDQHGESEEESPGHDYFVATPIKHVDHTVAALERAASTSKSIGELEAQVEELLGKVDQVQSEKVWWWSFLPLSLSLSVCLSRCLG